MSTSFGEFQQLQEVGVFSYSVIFDFKSFVNDLVGLRPRMVVWFVPKLGTELLGFLEPVLDSPTTIYAVCVIICVINYGLDVVRPEIAMDFGSTKWNRCLVSGLPTDSPLLI